LGRFWVFNILIGAGERAGMRGQHGGLKENSGAKRLK
jgi:hypothetical protein